MSKYDNLDARVSLEQEITDDLKRALEKRGFEVRHNGTHTSHAPRDRPDMEVWNSIYHINVEVTKTVKAGSDREFLSIKDHLDKIKEQYPRKRCFVLYISPETHYRMLNAMREHNVTRHEEKDMKMFPMSFFVFETLIEKLKGSPKEQYTAEQLMSLFDNYLDFVSDEKIAILLQEKLFSTDVTLRKDLVKREEEKHQRMVESLIKDLLKLEQDLRDYRIALASDAIKNVIFLVFIKLYEEKREHDLKENRFTVSSFKKYQEYVQEEKTKKAVHYLFDNIKNDGELKSCKLFTDSDKLAERLNDDFVIDLFIKPFAKYHFYATKIDGLGAAYEVLGKLSGKDVKVGQFFTPENVVKFMVRLSELDSDDYVLDPACGTGRFLIHAMYDMLGKVEGKEKGAKIESITKHQLNGTDNDPYVSKLAKMNMYIHGDGKTNIVDEDGLLLDKFDNKIDVILTNPPLGNLSYMLTTYSDDFRLKRMQVIPKRNLSLEKVNKFQVKINELRFALNNSPKKGKIQNMIQEYERKLASEKSKIEGKKADYAVTGNQLKGGALFINAAHHYLKDKRDSSAPPEWRGGKLLIILDEAVLNTDDYQEVRDFIRKYFFIKAVISLTPDTFVPVSNTSTKTSILYAIKKDDPEVIQQEPIFYGYAEKVGIDTRKRVCENYLFNEGNDILSKYIDFKKKLIESYDGTVFNKAKFMELNFRGGKL